ncbi:MAG TPA: urease accessory protein UreD [Amaricoccus sp.]|nr:urease accessory protein UreD [Amaricoccus sp.]
MADGVTMLHETFPRLQRTRGEARVALSVRRGRVRLDTLHQSGSAKAFLSRVAGVETMPEVVFLNTAGGLTGGDRLAYTLALGPGARAVATTQTAERAYASASGAAEVRVTLHAAAGARLHWLPQETILFEASSLRRTTTLDLEADAQGLTAETLVLGRAASGETLARVALRDTRLVRRDGRAVLLEPLVLDAAVLAAASPALLGGARAVASVALVAPGAEAAVEAARRVLTEEGVEAAASGWNGKCLVRVVGHDAWPVRRQVARVVEVLGGRPLPRVWMN